VARDSTAYHSLTIVTRRKITALILRKVLVDVDESSFRLCLHTIYVIGFQLIKLYDYKRDIIQTSIFDLTDDVCNSTRIVKLRAVMVQSLLYNSFKVHLTNNLYKRFLNNKE
jgi:hypothetical protein